jgi:hypothetical protein
MNPRIVFQTTSGFALAPRTDEDGRVVSKPSSGRDLAFRFSSLIFDAHAPPPVIPSEASDA